MRVINFADENPTVSKKAWRAFLEALIAEDVPLILVGSTRADDIVRDADILHLYKRAGWERFLLGLESTDEQDARSDPQGREARTTDREAIRLMREHGILSMATWVVGFEEETDRDYWRGLRQLLSYDPDQIQMLYVTPHRWTPYYRLAAHRTVIQTDRRRWDYKHQVLATRHMRPWRGSALVQVHRNGGAVAAARTLPRAVPSRPRPAARDALVHADGPARVALRSLELSARPLTQGWPDRRAFWGARAGRRGGSR